MPASLFALVVCSMPSGAAGAAPIRLHPENPHYFLFRDKPAVLLTSGEHYGAVLNLDFNFIPYLDELRSRGFNLTRTFSGTYREIPGSFGITSNTLAPKAGRYLSPWARTSTPGAADGGNKFDLQTWEPIYFKRLKEFLFEAGRRGIVVELVLFCTIYDDKLWAVNPMNAANNIQGVCKIARQRVYTLQDKELTKVQLEFARKVVAELRDFDNVYFEVCNEPYFGGVTPEWTDAVIATIDEAERGRPTRHLIAQNISNNSSRVSRPNPLVSIFNFHYSNPPDSVGWNYALKRAVADDETGFRGKHDRPYRVEAWKFLIAGGAVYSNLDYSFTCEYPDGTAVVTTSPGGGGPELRTQLHVLKEFVEGFDFIHMAPNQSVIKDGRIALPVAGGPELAASVRALVQEGKAYAVYVEGGSQVNLVLEVPAGCYKAEWVDTKSGSVAQAEERKHQGGRLKLTSPAYSEDIALRIKATRASE